MAPKIVVRFMQLRRVAGFRYEDILEIELNLRTLGRIQARWHFSRLRFGFGFPQTFMTSMAHLLARSLFKDCNVFVWYTSVYLKELICLNFYTK